jgi:uncharacterized protein (DUF58 family)
MAAAGSGGAVKGALGARWRQWQTRRLPAAPRIELNQRRIFIMPSRSGAGFFVVLLLVLLAAINYQNSMAYALVFLLGSIFVVAILHTYRNLSGLVISGNGTASVFVGEQARFALRLESSGKEHQAIGVGWDKQALQRIDVAPSHVQELALSLPTTRRGWLAAPRMRIETSFPLGVLTAWTWVDPGQRLLVYPQPLQGEVPTLHSEAVDIEDQAQRLHGQGVDDFQGLKQYQPGDSWRRMHWKAYSRGEGLLIKDFADLRGLELCLDFLALGGDVEQRLSRLCFWVLALSRQQRPFALQLPGLRLDTDSGEAHRDACLRALALYGEHP